MQVCHSSKCRLAMFFLVDTHIGQESAVDDFARELLRMLGFEEHGTILRTRYAIPLNICGEPSRSAQTDICLLHHASTIFLLVQEDKTKFSVKDPEAQMVAPPFRRIIATEFGLVKEGRTACRFPVSRWSALVQSSMSSPLHNSCRTRPIP